MSATIARASDEFFHSAECHQAEPGRSRLDRAGRGPDALVDELARGRGARRAAHAGRRRRDDLRPLRSACPRPPFRSKSPIRWAPATPRWAGCWRRCTTAICWQRPGSTISMRTGWLEILRLRARRGRGHMQPRRALIRHGGSTSPRTFAGSLARFSRRRAPDRSCGRRGRSASCRAAPPPRRSRRA